MVSYVLIVSRASLSRNNPFHFISLSTYLTHRRICPNKFVDCLATSLTSTQSSISHFSPISRFFSLPPTIRRHHPMRVATTHTPNLAFPIKSTPELTQGQSISSGFSESSRNFQIFGKIQEYQLLPEYQSSTKGEHI